MIKFIKNNKVICIVAVIVLAVGACLTLILLSSANSAMAQEQIKTAVAEASESVIPGPTQTPAALNPESISGIIEEREWRRHNIIPSLDNTVINDAKTWKIIEPDNFTKIKEEAVRKTRDIAKELFGLNISDDNNVVYYTDTDKDRKDIIRVTTKDEKILCVLAAETFDLIEIDYDLVPETALSGTDENMAAVQNKNKEGTLDENEYKIADKIAALFGSSAVSLIPSGYGSSYEILYQTYSVTLSNGKLIKFAILNNELYAVGVYPTEACMMECVYFEADIQMDPTIGKLAYPRNFKEGQPGKSDMTKDEAKKMYLSFLNLANGKGDYTDPKMTFYIDLSGKRENYWHIENNMLTMDIASKSKWMISLICSKLWNPQKDLTGIEYGKMGSIEYEGYVRNIMSSIYGKDLVKVETNAVYDGHFCTEDALMTDGSIYEFMFEDGKLQNVHYFANEACFECGPGGWKADSVYINTTTGKEYIPQ